MQNPKILYNMYSLIGLKMIIVLLKKRKEKVIPFLKPMWLREWSRQYYYTIYNYYLSSKPSVSSTSWRNLNNFHDKAVICSLSKLVSLLEIICYLQGYFKYSITKIILTNFPIFYQAAVVSQTTIIIFFLIQWEEG